MTIITNADALAHAENAGRGNLRSLASLLRSLVNGEVASKLELEAGTGVTGGTGTVYRSSVRKEGGIIKTSILIDLTGLDGSATDLDIIGVNGTANACHLGKITTKRNGTILGGRITCLEVPTGGPDDVDFYAADEATGVEDGGIAALTETALVTAGGAWTLGLSKGLSGLPADGQYLYAVNGEAAAAGTFTAGKFLIELEGYEA